MESQYDTKKLSDWNTRERGCTIDQKQKKLVGTVEPPCQGEIKSCFFHTHLRLKINM